MRSRSNTNASDPGELSPWIVSSASHLALVAALAWVMWPRTAPDKVDFEVYEMPRETQSKPVSLLEKPKEAPKPAEEKRAVFGASRKSVDSSEGIEVKRGNTVAKAPDQEKLRDDDADSLPVPVDEFMVNEMPKLEAEVRIPYPPEAKKAGVQGPVVMDLLIDASGKVREVKLVDGPGSGLDEAAVEAARGFRFKPGRVEDKPVAVRIRYSYRFVLER